MNIAIVLASGMGKRMGAGKNKTLITLGRKPLICYALENFQKSKQIDRIILVVKSGEENIFANILTK